MVHVGPKLYSVLVRKWAMLALETNLWSGGSSTFSTSGYVRSDAMTIFEWRVSIALD
jgi:hypothetical protein